MKNWSANLCYLKYVNNIIKSKVLIANNVYFKFNNSVLTDLGKYQSIDDNLLAHYYNTYYCIILPENWKWNIRNPHIDKC